MFILVDGSGREGTPPDLLLDASYLVIYLFFAQNVLSLLHLASIQMILPNPHTLLKIQGQPLILPRHSCWRRLVGECFNVG